MKLLITIRRIALVWILIFSGVPTLAGQDEVRSTDPEDQSADHIRNAIITNIQPVESNGALQFKGSGFNYFILGNFDQNKYAWDY